MIITKTSAESCFGGVFQESPPVGLMILFCVSAYENLDQEANTLGRNNHVDSALPIDCNGGLNGS